MKRLILILTILVFGSAAYAQLLEKSQSFYTNNVEIIYQPPLQKGFSSQRPVYKDVPKLNITLNIFDGYIQYLKNQKKIPADTRLLLMYSPEINSEGYDENPKLIKLQSLDLNSILEKVNAYLLSIKNTDSKYFADNSDKLAAIASSIDEQKNDFTAKLGLTQTETDITPITADSEFCLLNETKIAVIRPTEKNNRIYILTRTDNGYYTSVLADEGAGYYKNIASSYDGKYVYYSSDFTPLISEVSSGKIIKIFDENKIVLETSWAPSKNILSGMVLDKISQERTCFAFDAETQKHLLPDLNIKLLPENSLYAFPYWAPNSERLLFASAQALHLIDLKSNKLVPFAIRLKDSFSELIWSDGSDSVAITEVVGQTRNHAEFDDMDFRKNILRRYKISDSLEFTEDQAQRTESRRTIKPIGFSPNGRVIYIEGKMSGKRMESSVWELTKNCGAYLTSLPSSNKDREANESSIGQASELPMRYLFVFGNMNGRQKNIFDAGFHHSNQLYLDKQANIWFVGLPGKGDLQSAGATFSQRNYPYPFLGANNAVFTTIDAEKLKKFLLFLESYNLRDIKFSKSGSHIWLLGNFTGPLKLWEGELEDFMQGILGSGNSEAQKEK